MTLTVTLLRHAKSSRDDATLADIARPLAERGRRDALRMAAWMALNGIKPDLVLCSTSVRTRETLALVAPAVAPAVATRFEASLYHAEADVLLRKVQGLSSAKQHVLLIGHNPGFHDLALSLIGAGDKGLRASLAEKFSTCGCAVLTFAGSDWASVAPKAGALTHWMAPKRLA